MRERLGDHDRFLVECGRETVLVEAPTDAVGAPGDAIGLFFAPSRVHLFAGASGQRLLVRDQMARSA